MRFVEGKGEFPWVCVIFILFFYFNLVLSQVTAEQHTLAKYLLELTMVDYEMVHLPPSIVASAALALTMKVLDVGEWVSELLSWEHKLRYIILQ